MARKRQPNGSRLLARAVKGSAQTKTELAAELGISIEQLRHIETGRRKPTLPQACALEDHLAIPIRAWV